MLDEAWLHWSNKLSRGIGARAGRRSKVDTPTTCSGDRSWPTAASPESVGGVRWRTNSGHHQHATVRSVSDHQHAWSTSPESAAYATLRKTSSYNVINLDADLEDDDIRRLIGWTTRRSITVWSISTRCRGNVDKTPSPPLLNRRIAASRPSRRAISQQGSTRKVDNQEHHRDLPVVDTIGRDKAACLVIRGR